MILHEKLTKVHQYDLVITLRSDNRQAVNPDSRHRFLTVSKMAFQFLLLLWVILSMLAFQVDGVCRKEAITSSPSLFTRKVVNEAANITLVEITNTTSTVPCEFGKSIGFLGTVVWASDGCGANIDVCFQKGSSVLITCLSHGFRPKKCKVPSGKMVLSMIPEKHYSRSSCIFKQSYGFNDTIVYVTNGCRAQFRVGVQDLK